MKFLNFDRILCLSPHPDDVEYSMSGIVLKYQDTQFDILCLSAGGETDITTGDHRNKEIFNVWNKSGVNNYKLYFSPYVCLKDIDVDEWIDYIETQILGNSNYNCIIGPSECDSHFEHVLVSTFMMPLTRIDPYSIIQYKSPSTLDSWIPNLFVSIEEQYDIKKKMLDEFKSQLHRTYFDSNIIDRFHDHFQSSKKGKKFVELYKIVSLYE